MTKKQWKKLAKHFMADRRLPGIHYRINERHQLASCLREATWGGVVACHVSGTDCDGGRYHYSTNRRVGSVMAEWMDAEQQYAHADGMMQIWYTKPCKPVRYSRDLGLEAWEDGHPHVLYT